MVANRCGGRNGARANVVMATFLMTGLKIEFMEAYSLAVDYSGLWNTVSRQRLFRKREYLVIPSVNTDAEQTRASMDRIAQILADKHATLWINHDEQQSLSQRHSPAFYE